MSDQVTSTQEAPATPQTPEAQAPATPQTPEAQAPATPQTPEAQAPATPQTPMPTDYTLSIKPGFDADQEAINRFATYAQTAGVSQEHAQKMLDYQIQQAEYNEVLQQQQTQRNISEIRNDPILGGLNYENTVAKNDRVLQRFTDENFIKYLNTTGIATNPAFVRMINGIASVMSEDAFVTPGNSNGLGAQSPINKRQAAADAMFPHIKKLNEGK